MHRKRITALVTAAVIAIASFGLAPSASAAGPAASIDTSATRTASTGDIVLAWKPVTGATAYVVEVADSRSFSPSNVILKQTTSALRWVPTTPLWGAASSRQLYWRVTPQGVGAVATDAPANAFTRAAAPMASPSTPAANGTVDYPTPVTFAWAPVPGASSYTLRYAPVGSSSPTVVTKITTTSYAPGALAQGRYEWSIQPSFPNPDLRTEYAGRASASRAFTVTWAGSQPTLVAPADKSYANDLEFRWNTVDGAASYVVEISRDPAFTPSALVLRSEVVGTAFVPTAVLPSTTYYWRVLASSVDGVQGLYSAGWQVSKRMSADDASVPPGADLTTAVPSFTGLSTDAKNPTAVPFDTFALHWTAVPRATYYRVSVFRNGAKTVTCNTASTTATIVASSVAVGNATDALSGSSACLWDSSAANQIRPTTDTTDNGVDESLFTAKVQAVNMTASSTKAYGGSDPDDSDVVPSSESQNYFFHVTNGTTPPTTSTVEVNPLPATTTEVAPTLSWNPVTGADGYVVTLYTDAGKSSKIAELRTTTPLVRTTGVFVRNRTTSSTDSYVAVIQPAVGTGAPSTWKTNEAVTPGLLTWKRTGSAPSAGTVAYQGGTPLLRMTPTPSTALSGANRGYVVKIYLAKAQDPLTTLKVDQPSTVAAKTLSTSATTFKATSLPKGSYEFAWAVMDPNGDEGALSKRTAFVVGASNVTNLLATPSANSTAAQLSWRNAATASTYTVSIARAGASATTLTTNARTVVVPNLLPGQAYTWSVTAKDHDGNVGSASSSSTFTLPQRSLSTTSSSISGVSARTATIAWRPVTGASRYLVRVGDATRGLGSATTVETTALSYVPTAALTYGTAYVFDVRAVPEALGASSTRPITGVPTATGHLTVITAPGTLSGLRTTVSRQTVYATWTPLSGAARGASQAPGHVLRYRIARTDGLENAWSTTVVGGATAKTVTGLRAGTTYEFQVAAGNSVGQGPWSRSVSAKTADTTPSAPRLSSVSRADRSATARWSAPSSSGSKAISGYTVQKRTYSNHKWSTWATAGSTSASSRSFKLTSLTNGTKYEVRVLAKSSAGTGAASSSRLVTPAGKPKAPTSVKVTTAKHKAKVSWKKVASNGSAIKYYKVQYSTNGKTWKTLKTAKSSASSYTWTKAKKGKKYYVRVIAYNSVGHSSASSKVKFTGK